MYDMKNSRSSSSVDRLSELPDSLIFDIFWLLPIRDVVRTSKLSKRWRNLWTTSPFLNFSSDYWKESYLDSFPEFINRAIMLWRGAKLLKFKVMYHFELTEALVRDINVWLRFAKEKQVEELYLAVCDPDDDDYVEFESLNLCSSLKDLSLIDCPIGNGKVKWDSLKNLTIHGGCNFFEEHMISNVLRGSPKLEVLILTLRERNENLCIESSSLKKLSIEKWYDDHYNDISKHTELKIHTPNLERLEMAGAPYSKSLLEVSSLTDVTLGFSDWELCCYRSECSDNFCTKSIKQVLSTIQHVESITLSDWCCKVLGAMNKKSLLSPLSKVKFLKLNACFSKHEKSFSRHREKACLLKIFPKLKRLVIEEKERWNGIYPDVKLDDVYQDDQESFEFEANLPASFLLWLRTVEVTWAKADESIFSFIEILLKYASKLEKMMFRVGGNMLPSRPSYSLSFASMKLLKMPRSSPTAQFIFYEY